MLSVNKINKLLILGFLGNLILIILITSITLFGINRLKVNIDSYNFHLKRSLEYFKLVEVSYHLDLDLHDWQKYTSQHILTKNSNEIKEIERKINQYKNSIYSYLNTYDQLSLKSSQDEAQINKFKDELNKYTSLNLQILEHSNALNKNKAFYLSNRIANINFMNAERYLEEMIGYNVQKSIKEQELSLNFYNDSKKVLSVTTTLIMILGILSCFASVLLGVITVTIIAKNFESLTKKENELANNNLKLQQLYEKEMVLKHISNEIRQSLNLKEVLKSIVNEIGKYTNADRSFILEYNTKDNKFTAFDYEYTSSETLEKGNDLFIGLFNKIIHRLVNINRIIVIKDMKELECNDDEENKLNTLGIKSVLFAPIIYQESLVAIIVLLQNCDKNWTANEQEMISMVTAQAAIVLEQSMLFEQFKNVTSILIKKETELIEQNKQLQWKEELLREKNLALIKTKEDLEYANRELQIINKSLRELDEMKNNFISTVSHELRTPLTSIKGSLGLVLNSMVGDISDEIKSFLEMCYRNTDRLVRLINELLDISKIESGKIQLNKKAVNLLDIVNEATSVISTFAIENNVNIYNDIKEEITIFADYDRIAQVLYNLLSNSIKFSSIDKSKNAFVRLTTDQYHDYIRVTVEDNGIGIPYDKQQYIFEKFTQADNTSTRNKDGTGLGLAICKAIITEHQGKIWLESEEGKGTKISFTIPSQVIQEKDKTTDLANYI